MTDGEATLQAQGRFAVNVGSKAKCRNQAEAKEHGATDNKAPEDRKSQDDPCNQTGLHPEGSVEGTCSVVARVHGDDDVVVDDGEVFRIRLLSSCSGFLNCEDRVWQNDRRWEDALLCFRRFLANRFVSKSFKFRFSCENGFQIPVNTIDINKKISSREKPTKMIP